MVDSSYLTKLHHQDAHAYMQDDSAQHLHMLAALHQEAVRIGRRLYDRSMPVDEYAFSPDPNPVGVDITWQPDYEQEIRVESITASLPIGITAAVIQLGQRRIPLLGVGAATTAQTLVNVTNQGIIINRSDIRKVILTGTPTSGHYVALAGFLFERHGNL